MAAHEDVEEDQAKGDQGDADGHVGGSHEPVHASIFNQIWLISQHPQQHPLIRGLSGDSAPPNGARAGVRVQWVERESMSYTVLIKMTAVNDPLVLIAISRANPSCFRRFAVITRH